MSMPLALALRVYDTAGIRLSYRVLASCLVQPNHCPFPYLFMCKPAISCTNPRCLPMQTRYTVQTRHILHRPAVPVSS
jgi:hypothetical protein